MDRETWKIKTCPVCKTKFLSTTGKDIYCGRKCYMAQRFGMPRKKKEGTSRQEKKFSLLRRGACVEIGSRIMEFQKIASV